MTDLTEFLSRLETNLQQLRRMSEDSCAEFFFLPQATQQALYPVIAFLGCPAGTANEVGPPNEIEPPIREHLARLMLLKLSADTAAPLWSSQVLEGLVDAQLRIPGGCVGDILLALVEIWDQNDTELTATVAAFVNDIVILCFTQHRASYESSNFTWLVERLARPQSTIAYLSLLALPSQYLPKVKTIIINSLSGTEYAHEAARMLDDDD